MPDAIITSTASTFGTITGTFAADQSTITGTVSGTITGTLSGSVGVPGPAGSPGAPGAPGVGVPAGGTAGQYLQKIDGTNYNTDWVTLNLSAYALLSGASFSGFCDFINGLSSSGPVTLLDNGYLDASGLDGDSRRRIRFGAGNGGGFWGLGDFGFDGSNLLFGNDENLPETLATRSWVTAGFYPLTGNPSGFITSAALSGYAPLASPAFTGNPTAPTAALADNDTSIATTAFVQQELLSGTANARNLEVYVRNQTGSTIPAGTIVYINGATGNRPTITLAQANNDANSAQTFGFTKAAIANNGFGFVIVRGELENVDTSALTEGVQLYLSPTTAGTYTTTKPSAPQHLVYVGICVRAHPTQGVILVAIQNGYELGEIHDIQLGTLANNDLLAYESSTDLWKNKTFSALGLLTSADIAGKANSASPALTGNVTITSNSTGAALFIEQAGTGNILTLHDQAADTTFVAIDQNGKINTIASSAAGGAGLNLPHGVAPTTPVNGDIWTTTASIQWRANGATRTVPNLQTANTFSAGAKQSFTNSAATSGANLVPVATDPTTLANGDVWVNSTSNDLKVRLNGVSETVAEQSWVTAQGYITSSALTPYLTSATAASTYQTLSGMSSYLTTASAASTYFTIASAANKADLASPALTGTPTAPTAAAATNTTQIATTAFVQQEVPAASTTAAGKVELATNAEVITGTSTTLAIVPSAIPFALTDPRLRSMAHMSFTRVSGSGTVSAGNVGIGIREMYLSSLATGRASFSYGWTGQLAVNMSSADWTKVNFSKKLWVSGATNCGMTGGTSFIGDANTMSRVTLGGYTSDTATGDMTVKGIGWKKVGGTSPFFTLTVHNGTTLTDVATTITQSSGKVISWMIYSDGTGNVTLYIDGVQAATTSAGPTGTSNALQATYREQVEAVATPTVRGIMECSGGAIYIEP